MHIDITNTGVGSVSVRGGGKWISTTSAPESSLRGVMILKHNSKDIGHSKLHSHALTVASDNLRENTSAPPKPKN